MELMKFLLAWMAYSGSFLLAVYAFEFFGLKIWWAAVLAALWAVFIAGAHLYQER